MLVNTFVNQDGEKISFTRKQASDFAKNLAHDFNPLHDIDAKRFCVPGDLLFSILLSRYGIREKVKVEFNGMVTEQHSLHFVESCERTLSLRDDADKSYIDVEQTGNVNRCPEVLDQLVKAYVAYSGESFPGLLVPLMERHNVMINPARPMVMYTHMQIEFSRTDFHSLSLRAVEPELLLNGKRGKAILKFELLEGIEVVGRGEKHMVLSGLRAFDKVAMDLVVAEDAARKKSLAA